MEKRTAVTGWDLRIRRLRVHAHGLAWRFRERVRGAACRAVREQSGQGTTEYAILVGVLVLMAIIAVVAFRDRLQELWTSITDGINSL